mgnify:CR=1 FL=1
MDGFVSWLRQLQFDGVWQTALLVAASLLCAGVKCIIKHFKNGG